MNRYIYVPLNILAFLSLSYLIIVVYIQDASFYFGGPGFILKNFTPEIPFISAILIFLFFSNIHNYLVKYLLPVIPILLSYFVFDVFHLFLNRGIRISDFYNLFLIFNFSPEMALGLMLILSVIPLTVCFIVWRAYKETPRNQFIRTMIYKVLFLLGLIFLFSSDVFIHYQKKIIKYHSWSEISTIRRNGRFASMFYYYQKEKENLEILNNFRNENIDILSTLYPGQIKMKRNIHIILLESFLDPRMIKNIQFNQSPLALNLRPYLKDEEHFSHVISPVYGGYTAQAEFELLSGIKAFAHVGSIEFNVMKGHPMSSFVNRLRETYYTSMLTSAASPAFFNSQLAYKSLGFEEVHFLDGEKDFRNTKDQPIFDGDLFKYNLESIKKKLGDGNNTPLLNYVVGIYGHFPYLRNKGERPDIIETSHQDERVNNISNQFYYRTKALAEYIHQLTKLDPNSIIYITSDHLPPIFEKDLYYKFDLYINISLLIINGRIVDVSGRKLYEIPQFIWTLLTEKDARTIQQGDMERIYYRALLESISPRKGSS